MKTKNIYDIYEMQEVFGHIDSLHSPYNRLGTMVSILSHLSEPPKRILDLGCGTGYFSSVLSTLFPKSEIVGIDISKKAIELARKKYSNIQFSVADSEKRMPFKDRYFDLVISGEHIEHLRDVDTYLEQIHRVLTSKGHLLLSTPNLASWINRLLLLFGRQPWYLEPSYRKNIPIFSFLGYTFPENSNSPAVGHLRLYTLDSLKKILSLYGLPVKKVSGAKMMSKPVLKQIDTFFSHFPGMAFGFIVLSQKK